MLIVKHLISQPSCPLEIITTHDLSFACYIARLHIKTILVGTKLSIILPKVSLMAVTMCSLLHSVVLIVVLISGNTTGQEGEMLACV